MHVRAESIDQPMGSLSGGNQQKMLVGRELARPHSIVIARNLRVGWTSGYHYIREQILLVATRARQCFSYRPSSTRCLVV